MGVPAAAATPSPPPAAGASGPPVLSSPAAPEPPSADDTAETVHDSAQTVADALSQRAELVLLAEQARQQDAQARIDRLKAAFNDAQEERAEMMRESNALRDMALEQAKKDDEVLKKYIAMI